jgi:hypothetical protein
MIIVIKLPSIFMYENKYMYTLSFVACSTFPLYESCWMLTWIYLLQKNNLHMQESPE